jgi:hypothetical protein
MNPKPNIQIEVKKLANAFNNYRKKYRLTWKKIIAILDEIPHKFNFGTSKSNIQAVFRIGGKRIPDNKELHPKYYKQQIEIIEYLNNRINPRIVFINGVPTYEDDENFSLVENDANGEVPVKLDKDEFIVYYWRHGETLGNGVLTLFKDSLKASLQIIYSHKEYNLLLEGSYTLLKGLVTIRLNDKANKEIHPYTQIVYLRNPDSFKHCYFATFSTAHRGAHTFPVGGIMLLFRKEKIEKYKSRIHIEDLATYILYKQRFKIQNSGFDFNLTDDKIETDDQEVNSFFEVLKYQGIYEGAFINPKKQTYETCIIKINDSGIVNMLVCANLTSKPFEGIIKIYRENQNLIISYHYKKEINDYRMKLIFDISRYHPENGNLMHGLMNGLELASEEPMTSTIAIRKINDTDNNILHYKDKIKYIELSNRKNFKIFEKDLKEKKIYDFFFAKKQENFTSIGLLNKLKNQFN